MEIVCTSVSVATTRCHSQGGGPQMNKYVQASSDHHKMSLAGGPQVWWGREVAYLTFLRGGTLLCDLSHNAFDVVQPLPCEQIDACKNITLP